MPEVYDWYEHQHNRGYDDYHHCVNCGLEADDICIDCGDYLCYRCYHSSSGKCTDCADLDIRDTIIKEVHIIDNICQLSF